MQKNGENSDVLETDTDDSVSRPPRPPQDALGPYYQFITTDLDNMLWIGSVLIFRHVAYERPTIEFHGSVKVDLDWEILYENLFNMHAYRINLKIELPSGVGDERINWVVDWGDKKTNGAFYIARYHQKWRGAFFSCNGFDATVSKEVASGLKYEIVWNHLLSKHEETPFHICIWGGDQNYNDFVLEDIGALQDWSRSDWDLRWKWQIPDTVKYEIEQYYFYNYTEHWGRRKEMRKALESIPSVMTWDDHDIFDGAGSYPPLLNDSPVMRDLFQIAQKMRLLFQHHTTPEKARQHQLFGYQGYNFFARCGPNLAILGTDGRSERDEKTVQHEKTWDIIFERLNNELHDVKHLIMVVAIPMIFARFKTAESMLETWKRLAMKWRSIPLNEKTNSIFGLPEIYDDLLDEWTHENHMEERNRIISRLQNVSEKKKTRVTVFSGDVHCCGVGRFRTRRDISPPAINDPKLMYQIISSAIVNRPPPHFVIRAAHLFSRKWYPVKDTQEALIDFFQYAPEKTKKLHLQKLLPNRNWCYFEQSDALDACPSDEADESFSFLRKIFWMFVTYLLLLLGLSSILNSNNTTNKPSVKQGHSKNTTTLPDSTTDYSKCEGNHLKIRFWLENTAKGNGGPPFANYELSIPELN